MKICYLCADRGIPLRGHKGASAHVRGLVRAFARLGHEVVVLACGDAPAAGGGASEAMFGPGVDVMNIAAPGLLQGIDEAAAPRVFRALGHLWNNTSIERTLEELVRDRAPDLLYERYGPFGIAGGVVARRYGLPHLLEVNAPLAWEGERYRRQALTDAAEVLERAAFTNAQQILVVSAELRDLLVEQGINGNRITVVPNGVDDELFAAAEPRQDDGTVTIGFVGSLKPWHGLEHLRDAFLMLRGDERFRLLIVGDGPAATLFQDLQESLPDRVLLAGPTAHERVPQLLANMDIAVAPYPAMERFYFSPLKMLEYMAAGLPVVASDIGQLRELVRPGDTGLLVAPGDPLALSEALLTLAADRDLRRRMGAAAAAEAHARHSWTQRAVQILEHAAVPA